MPPPRAGATAAPAPTTPPRAATTTVATRPTPGAARSARAAPGGPNHPAPTSAHATPRAHHGPSTTPWTPQLLPSAHAATPAPRFEARAAPFIPPMGTPPSGPIAASPTAYAPSARSAPASHPNSPHAATDLAGALTPRGPPAAALDISTPGESRGAAAAPSGTRLAARLRRQDRASHPAVIHGHRASDTGDRYDIVPHNVSTSRLPRREFFPPSRPGLLWDAAWSRTLASAPAVSAAALTAAVSAATRRLWRPLPATLLPSPTVDAPRPPSRLAASAIAASVPAHFPYRSVLLDTASHGIDYLYSGPSVFSVFRDNHPSAYGPRRHADHLHADISAQLEAGLLLDVTDLYNANPLLSCIVAPLAVVPKPSSGKLRTVVDASAGPGASLNGAIHPGALGPVRLGTVDELASDICELRALYPGVALSLQVYDFRSAYRYLPIRPADWHTLTLAYNGRLYWSLVGQFGVRSIGHYMCLFSHALAATLSSPSRRHRAFVDDVAIVARTSDFALADAAFQSTARAWGFDVNDVKLLEAGPPAPSKTWTGWTFNCDKLTLTIPTARLTRLRADVARALASPLLRGRDLASLVGVLSYVARGVPALRSYTSALFAALRHSSPLTAVTLSDAARADLGTIAYFLRSHRGASLIPRPYIAHLAIHGWCDAASYGFGFLIPSLGVYAGGPWPDAALGDLHSNIRELIVAIAMIVAISRLPVARCAQHIRVHTDNSTTLACINRLYTSSPNLAGPTRALAYFAASASIRPSAQHIAGTHNTLADALSRGLPTPHLGTRLRVPRAWFNCLIQPSPSLQAVRRWVPRARDSSASTTSASPSATPPPAPSRSTSSTTSSALGSNP